MSDPKSLFDPSGLSDTTTEPRRGRVLIIESDTDIATLLETRLTREPGRYEIWTAETAQGGLYLADQHAVDVALLARDLPDADSMRVLKALRSTPTPCEVIVMTVDPTVEIFVQALDAGAFDLVVKPFSNLTLVTAKLANAVAKVHAERECIRLRARLAALETGDGDGVRAVVDAPLARAESPLSSTIDIDPVTGLANRGAAELRFREETSRALRYDRPLAVVFISVDRLDHVIEADGYEAADRLLRDFGRVIIAQIRDVDFLARRQGGEFMLLLPETTKADAAVVAERIRTELTASFAATPSDATGLTASFGVAGLPTDTMNADLLRQAGEVALAQAEASGDCVMLYEAPYRR